MIWKGIEREKIPWFPAIDGEKCTGCNSCFEFCTHSVYQIKDNTSRVRNPYNSVVGCSNCRELCPDGAISFPDIQEVREIIRRSMHDHSNHDCTGSDRKSR